MSSAIWPLLLGPRSVGEPAPPLTGTSVTAEPPPIGNFWMLSPSQ